MKIFRFCYLFYLFGFAFWPGYFFSNAKTVCAQDRPKILSASKDPEITNTELREALLKAIPKVEEFKYLQSLAQQMRLKLYLFGGSAASFAHYVKWDLQRLKGQTDFQKERFDYDYSSIFRSTQDLDIVVDGKESDVRKIKELLREKFFYFHGSKTAWDVRPLKTAMEANDSLFSFDFQNQHTDSNSTGLIDLSAENPNHVIKDLKDWESKVSPFEEDVRLGKLHYYFSKSHKKTARYLNGDNPEIFSVIRYFIKAFQFELEIRDEDLAPIKKIIADFEPNSIQKDSYPGTWIEKNAKKLFQQAVDVEYAWDILEKLKLREKLIAIKGDVDSEFSLAWWMNKEPLRTRELGKGKGQKGRKAGTISELGDLVVTHRTREFSAYESITRSHRGSPNIFISRENATGERAAFGEGFYAQVGRKGSSTSRSRLGLGIRLQMNPEAVEGVDFVLESFAGDYFVIIKNKNAFTVIPENLNLTPFEYLQILIDGKVDEDDDGTLMRMKRRLGNKMSILSTKEKDQIFDFLIKNVKQSPQVNKLILSEFFSGLHPMAQNLKESQQRELISAIMSKAKDQDAWNDIARYYFSQKYTATQRDLLERLIKIAGPSIDHSLALYVFSQKHSADKGDLLLKVLKNGDQSTLSVVASIVLPAVNYPEESKMLELIIPKADAQTLKELSRCFFATVPGYSDTKILRMLVDRCLEFEAHYNPYPLSFFVDYFLVNSPANQHYEIKKLIINMSSEEDTLISILKSPLLVTKNSENHKLLQILLTKLLGKIDSYKLAEVTKILKEERFNEESFEIFKKALKIKDSGKRELLIVKTKTEKIFQQIEAHKGKNLSEAFLLGLLDDLMPHLNVETADLVENIWQAELKKTKPSFAVLLKSLEFMRATGTDYYADLLDKSKKKIKALDSELKPELLQRIEEYKLGARSFGFENLDLDKNLVVQSLKLIQQGAFSAVNCQTEIAESVKKAAKKAKKST